MLDEYTRTQLLESVTVFGRDRVADGSKYRYLSYHYLDIGVSYIYSKYVSILEN